MVTCEDLRCCELFQGLTDDELQELAAIARVETYQEGELICSEHELAERLFVLDKGRVQVNTRLRPGLEPGGEATIEEVERGRIFGWSCLARQRRFTASARALEPVAVIVFYAEELNGLFSRDAHIGFVVMKQLADVIASRLLRTRELCQVDTPQDRASPPG
jgi:CRP/FNR family transcriptional regulator, cyclic AMP receptor protein